MEESHTIFSSNLLQCLGILIPTGWSILWATSRTWARNNSLQLDLRLLFLSLSILLNSSFQLNITWSSSRLSYFYSGRNRFPSLPRFQHPVPDFHISIAVETLEQSKVDDLDPIEQFHVDTYSIEKQTDMLINRGVKFLLIRCEWFFGNWTNDHFFPYSLLFLGKMSVQ